MLLLYVTITVSRRTQLLNVGKKTFKQNKTLLWMSFELKLSIWDICSIVLSRNYIHFSNKPTCVKANTSVDVKSSMSLSVDNTINNNG